MLSSIKTDAYDPYVAEKISQEEFIDRAEVPLKDFMLRNTETSSLNLFCDLDKSVERPADESAAKALPMHVIVPSFMERHSKARQCNFRRSRWCGHRYRPVWRRSGDDSGL